MNLCMACCMSRPAGRGDWRLGELAGCRVQGAGCRVQGAGWESLQMLCCFLTWSTKEVGILGSSKAWRSLRQMKHSLSIYARPEISIPPKSNIRGVHSTSNAIQNCIGGLLRHSTRGAAVVETGEDLFLESVLRFTELDEGDHDDTAQGTRNQKSPPRPHAQLPRNLARR
jgi:hypothetical protein